MVRKEKEKERLKQYRCLEEDSHFKTAGVLLSDEIEYCVDKFKMIDPFDPDHLKPASYELTVGREYSIGGKIKKLADKGGENLIEIPPFEVVIIRTRETINLPRFLIARWNIRVRKAYEGLLWVGGPQVDPGWVGQLSCPLYNLSDKAVTLRFGEEIAVIDFVVTTPFNKGKSIEYQLKKGESQETRKLPSRILFDDYNPEKLESALYTEASKRINTVEKKMHRVEAITALMFTGIAILFAALGLIVTSKDVSSEIAMNKWVVLWASVGVIFSIIAIFVSLIGRVKLEIKNKYIKVIISIFYILYVFISAFAILAITKYLILDHIP